MTSYQAFSLNIMFVEPETPRFYQIANNISNIDLIAAVLLVREATQIFAGICSRLPSGPAGLSSAHFAGAILKLLRQFPDVPDVARLRLNGLWMALTKRVTSASGSRNRVNRSDVLEIKRRGAGADTPIAIKSDVTSMQK
jgi:hypothetical protein